MIHPPVLERIQVGKREHGGWGGQHQAVVSAEPSQDLPVLEVARGTGLTGRDWEGLVTGGQASTRTEGREADARSRCWEFSSCAVSQLLISSVWLKGCGGDDSSCFLARILLGSGLAVVPLPLGTFRNLPNKQSE